MPSTGGGGAVSSSCWGTITATFTWVPSYDGELPPASVIIQEDSSVYAYNDEMEGDPVATPQADDGLGDAATVSPGSTFSMASSSGTFYSVKQNPGTSFSISRSPFTLSSATNGDALSSVSYRTSALPVTVTLGGVTVVNHLNQALIGQGITASLQVPFGALPSNWQWSIDGGDPFKSYEVSANLIEGRVYYLDSLDKSSRTCHFYCRNDQLVTVTCSATVLINGQTLQVMPKATVAIIAPAHDFMPTLYPTIITQANDQTVHFGPYDVNAGVGARFEGSVLTPPQFTPPDGGFWHFLQIASPKASATDAQGQHNQPNWGLTGLDQTYPYAPGPYAPQPGYPGGWSCNGVPHTTVDSPDINFASLDFANTFTHVDVDSRYSMYMMYQPPGLDVQWVPLHRYDWGYHIDAARPAGGWVGGAIGTTIDGPINQPWHVHPEWHFLIN